MLTIVLLAIVIALLFDFLNGMNDAANSIATIVATRVFSPTMAVCWAAFWNFAAIFIFGVSVAHTMGEGIVDPSRINEYLILAALIGSVIWVWLCTHFGMPISVSHALIGGLIGPVWFTFGGDALVASGIFKIAIFIVLSPLIGMILGFFMMCLTMLVFHKKHPMKVEGLFKGLQLFSSAIFSLGHGANDAQKTMGIIAILLYSVAGSNTFVSDYLYENTGEFHVPAWLIVTCYSVIALGTIIGGKKVIKTLGDVGPIETRAGILCRDFRSFDIDGNSRTGDSREYDSHDYRLYYRGWNHERGCFCSVGYGHEYRGCLDSYDSGNHRDVLSCLLGDGVVPDLAGVSI